MDECTVVIIGPIGAGKTSIGKKTAKLLDKKFIDLDNIRQRYYSETSYNEKESTVRFMMHGFREWYNYQKPFELYSVKRVLEDYKGRVISFAGGQSVYSDPGLLDDFIKTMEPIKHVYMLTPYPDDNKSMDTLAKKLKAEEVKMNEIFIPAKSNRIVAKNIIYTEEKSAEFVAKELAESVVKIG